MDSKTALGMSREEIKSILREVIAEQNSDKISYSPKKNKSFKERWGEGIASLGFSQIPRLIVYAGDISNFEFKLLTLLCSFDDCSISDKRLSHILGVSRRQVTTNIKRLEDKGWIRRYRKMDRTAGYKRRHISLDPAKKKMMDMLKDPKVCDLFKKPCSKFSLKDSLRKIIQGRKQFLEHAMDRKQKGRKKAEARDCYKSTGSEVRCKVTVPPVPALCLFCEKFYNRKIEFLLDPSLSLPELKKELDKGTYGVPVSMPCVKEVTNNSTPIA